MDGASNAWKSLCSHRVMPHRHHARDEDRRTSTLTSSPHARREFGIRVTARGWSSEGEALAGPYLVCAASTLEVQYSRYRDRSHRARARALPKSDHRSRAASRKTTVRGRRDVRWPSESVYVL